MSRTARFVIVFTLSVPAVAQPKDWGNRREGIGFHQNGLRDYELLGFYAYLQNFPLRDDVSLRLRFFSLEDNERAFVSARDLWGTKDYAMIPNEGSIKKIRGGWREFTGWRVGDVLKGSGIGADNLGVMVRLKTNAEYEENLAPAVVLDEREQIPRAITEYILYLEFGRALKSLAYEVEGQQYSDPHDYSNPKIPKDKTVGKGSPTPIVFPANRIPLGPVTIHIKREYLNSTADAPEIVYHFYHKPL